MSQRLRLGDGIAELEIDAALGGAIARYDLIRPEGRTPLFRPAPADPRDPFELACNLLLPWSNRISGGGFTFEGAFHALEPNRPGEPFPIHGNAFAAPWTVVSANAVEAVLALESDGPGPFRYNAEVRYALEEGALRIALSVTHRGERALPYGIGLHPWLPRTPLTTLQAQADAVWLEDARHLPAGLATIASRPDWDFRTARALPRGWINNAFTGWNGMARLHWPERGLGLEIEAEPALSTYIVYSPEARADFVCFEPVSHSVDAFNLPGANGLKALQPGQSLGARCRFAPVRLSEGSPL